MDRNLVSGSGTGPELPVKFFVNRSGTGPELLDQFRHRNFRLPELPVPKFRNFFKKKIFFVKNDQK